MEKYNIFWFRRDLRLYDNHGLSKATSENLKVIPIFIFDTSITDKLPSNDKRVNFIYDSRVNIDSELEAVVFDLLGKELIREKITGRLDISCLEKGTYIINLTDGVNTSSHKILKN